MDEARENKIRRTLLQPFITPFIGNFSLFGRTSDKILVNTFVRHENDDDKYAIYLLLDQCKLKYKSIRSRLVIMDDFIEEISTENDQYIIFKFKVPSNKYKDYDYILSGRYSKVSKDFKNIIITNNNLIRESGEMNKTSIMYKILWRNPLYKKGLEKSLNVTIDRDAELWDLPDIEGRETFKESYLK